MPPIPWTLLSGENVEEMIAVMLLRDNRLGKHIRANPGDGGIDVFIPADAVAPIGENYQIKNFTNGIKAAQQAQIRESLRAAQKTSDSGKFFITHCYITVPTLPTTEDEKWLERFTKREKLTFTTSWYGLSHIQALVSDHPSVVDYYLNNRQEYCANLITQAQNMALEALRFNQEEHSGTLQPARVASLLGNIQQRVNEDPLYEYHFSTSPTMPDLHDKRNVVATQVTEISADLYLVIDIYAHFPDAIRIRPLKIRMKMQPESEDEKRQVEDFQRFGGPVRTHGTVTLDLPGNLGAENLDAIIHLLPSLPAGGPQIREYTIVDADENQIAKCLLRHISTSKGAVEGNYMTVTEDVDGVFQISWRWDVANHTTNLTISLGSIAGKPAAQILPSVTFLASLLPENTLILSDQFVPRSAVRMPLDSFTANEGWRNLAIMTRDLVDIQQIADRQVLMPAQRPSVEELKEIQFCAMLARDNIVRGTWTSIEATALAEVNRDLYSQPKEIKLYGIRELVIGNDIYNLGEAEMTYKAAILDPNTTDGYRFIPSGDNTAVARLLSRD